MTSLTSTLESKLQTLGALLRTNLGLKGINTNVNDGLTTLINKVNDINSIEERTGFFADIGFFNDENWTEPPVIVDDTLIFNADTTFILPENANLPSTFTAAFIISVSNSTGYIDWDGRNLSIIEGVWGNGRFEAPMILKRNNGGGFELETPISGDEYHGIDDFGYISFNGEEPITISNFVYTDTYYNGTHYDNDFTLYDLLTYNIVWDDNDNLSDTRPTQHPTFLTLNDNIIKHYNITDNSENNFVTTQSSFGQYDIFWGCWNYKQHNDSNIYSWHTNDDFINQTSNYIKLYGSGENRVDRYILGEGNAWAGFANNTTTINEEMPLYWKIGFDYIFTGTGNDNKDAYVQIGPDNHCIQVGKISGENYLDLFGSGRTFTNTNSVIHFELEPKEYHQSNGTLYMTYRIVVGQSAYDYNETWIIENSSISDALPHNLYKVIQNNTAKITNLYYKASNIALLDKCKKDRVNSLYGGTTPFKGSSTNTFTHNDNEYTLSGSGQYWSGRKITALDGINNARLRVKFKLNTTTNAAYNQFFICCTDQTPSSTEATYPYAVRVRNDKLFQYFQFTTEDTIYTHSTAYSSDWFYLEAIKVGTSWTMKLYDADLNQLATNTRTITSTLGNPKWYIGLNTEKGTNHSVHIQEILAEKLGDE